MANEKRRRLTKEEGLALVRRWRESGETRAEFCRRTSVGTQVLSYWIGREAGVVRATRATRSDFVVVSAPHVATRDRSEPSAGSNSKRSGKAVLVVMSEVSSVLLAQTVRELLGEVEA